MSLSLRSIYEETRQRYRLRLICGEKGLDNQMSWVYISEDLSASDFLQDGELVISTGIISRSHPNWLGDFIRVLIEHRICGLILNVGPYVQTDDITDEIRTLCDEAGFPLFTMPWQIHIYDITHDYYNRIFRDFQNDTVITDAFQDLLRGHDVPYSLSILNTCGFPQETTYAIACIHFPSVFQKDAGSTLPLFSVISICERFLRAHYTSFQFFRFHEIFLLAAPDGSLEHFRSVLASLADEWKHHFPNCDFYAGIGGLSPSLREMPKSYTQALAAASMARHRKKALFPYDDLGFFKILLSVNDRSVLRSYAQEQLGALLSYDASHKSEYLETLRQYLICDGSIRRISEALYCHRNTINYRIQILKKEFGYQLDDSYARFELSVAFEILDYLERFREDQSL